MNNTVREEPTYITRNISFYPREYDIVMKLAEESGIGTFSGALRVIINQWAASQPRPVPSTN